MAKWPIGEAAPYVKEHDSFARVAPRLQSRNRFSRARQTRRYSSDDGFTLIELVIVIGVMPIVIGALAVGMLSVFNLQSTVSNRLTDSGDAQVISVNYQNDVQSASMITTANAPASAPAPCEPASGLGSGGYQILGLQLGNGNEVSYIATHAATGTSYDLFRNVCASGSTVPTTSVVVARDMPASIVNPATPPASVSCTSSSATCANVPPTNDPAYQLDWTSTLGVTGVTFSTTAPASNYSYTLIATPIAASSSTQLAQVATPSTGCGFATSGTGDYAQNLCFVDFSPWANGPPAQSGGNDCTAPQSGFSNPLAMSAGLANSPFTLDFCMSVSASYNQNQHTYPPGTPITGSTNNPGTACGVAAATGWDDITASPLPTYTCPPTSEAFLGNNGFYTGVSGDPALYEVDESSDAIINITNITLLGANGSVASNWHLVTGDAESTDGTDESITWSTNNAQVPFTLMPNSTNPLTEVVQSYVGNACNSTATAINTTNLTGVLPTPLSSVTCTSADSTNKTGTVMLEALTPSSLTVTLHGGGLQAMFMGVLLSS